MLFGRFWGFTPFGGLMYKKAVSAFYVINIAFQAIFTLAWQIALGFGIGYLAVRFLSAPSWIYVPLILVGAVTGFVTMIRFLIAAMKSLERLEAQHEQDRKRTRVGERQNEKTEN